MSEVIKPIRGMSVCKFDGLDFEYKKHRVQVTTYVEFDEYASVYFNVHVDGVAVNHIDLLDEQGLVDDWCEFQHTPKHSLFDTEFHDLVKKVVDWHLAEQQEVM
jgi:hypothetical protein